MRVSLIVAMSQNRVIGINNRLPWHLSADLRRFKTLTMGKPILMGRKTHESIGRALPGRQNLILSRGEASITAGCVTVASIEQAFAIAEGAEELMVIGGSSVYEAMLSRADRIYLTLIDMEFEGDTFFPEFDPTQWKEVSRDVITNDVSVPFTYQFLMLDRCPVNRPKANFSRGQANGVSL